MAFIQQVAEQSSSAVTSFTTSAMTVTAGNAVVLCVVANTPTGNTVVSDSLGNRYDAANTQLTAATRLSIFRATQIKGGSTTYTVVPGASAFCTVSAQEYSGMSVNPIDAYASATAVSGTASPGAVNPASSNALYVACGTHDSGTVTFTFNASGEGWAQRANLTDATKMPLWSQDLASASGSKTGSATMGGSVTWASCVATFAPYVEAGSGGGPFDDRYRFRPSQFSSGTSTLGTKRSAWSDDACDFGRRDAIGDAVTRVF